MNAITLATISDAEELGLAKSLGTGPLVARVLAARGWSDHDAARAYLWPNMGHLPMPWDLPNMREAAERLGLAIRRKERVFVFGDRDVDGQVAAFVLSHFLQGQGVPVTVRLPVRGAGEGYGLSQAIAQEIAASGAQLAITVDCGVTAGAEVAWLRSQGIDVIVTDHHEPDGEVPPGTVNPKLPGNRFPGPAIAGAAVAWYLLMAARNLLKSVGDYQESPETNPLNLVGLVGMACIADVTTLQGANRILGRVGLEQLARQPWPGIDALWEMAGHRSAGMPAAHEVAYKLGPRMNAAGRVGDPHVVLEMLGAASKIDAMRSAWQLEQWNRERKSLEKLTEEFCAAAIAEHGWDAADGPPGLVVAGESLPEGVVGIVAARFAERLGKPTIVLSTENGIAKGSGRAVEGFDLLEGLRDCAECLERFGGHAMAAGMELRSENIDLFREAFVQSMAHQASRGIPAPTLKVDGVARIYEMSLAHVRELGLLEPVGKGNPPARFLLEDAQVVRVDTMGEGGPHVSWILQQGQLSIRGLVWRAADRWKAVPTGSRVNVVVEPQLNVWRGQSRVQCEMKEFSVVRAA